MTVQFEKAAAAVNGNPINIANNSANDDRKSLIFKL